MNYSYLKLVRRLKLWVVILAILNVTIISTIGVNMIITKKNEAIVSDKGVDSVSSFFVNYLKLNDSQAQQFDSIISDYNIKRYEVGVRLRDVRDSLNVPEVEKDTVVLNKIYEDFISALSLNRNLAVVFYDDIRAICDSEQVLRFDDILNKIIITSDIQSGSY